MTASLPQVLEIARRFGEFGLKLLEALNYIDPLGTTSPIEDEYADEVIQILEAFDYKIRGEKPDRALFEEQIIKTLNEMSSVDGESSSLDDDHTFELDAERIADLLYN